MTLTSIRPLHCYEKLLDKIGLTRPPYPAFGVPQEDTPQGRLSPPVKILPDFAKMFSPGRPTIGTHDSRAEHTV